MWQNVKTLRFLLLAAVVWIGWLQWERFTWMHAINTAAASGLKAAAVEKCGRELDGEDKVFTPEEWEKVARIYHGRAGWDGLLGPWPWQVSDSMWGGRNGDLYVMLMARIEPFDYFCAFNASSGTAFNVHP